jgi:DNA-directed RNA polymerase specialized sigma subunit
MEAQTLKSKRKSNHIGDNLSPQSTAFLEMLTKRGIIEDIAIDDTRIRKADKDKKRNMHHNTLMLLEHYRDISWILECFPANIAKELNRPMKDLDSLLALVSSKLDMEDRKLEGRLASIQRSRILMDRLNDALTMLKQKPNGGQMMYDIIYQTYIVPEELNHLDIIYRLNISSRHYYRLKAQAVNLLSIRLWATPTGELDAWLDVLTILEGV